MGLLSNGLNIFWRWKICAVENVNITFKISVVFVAMSELFKELFNHKISYSWFFFNGLGFSMHSIFIWALILSLWICLFTAHRRYKANCFILVGPGWLLGRRKSVSWFPGKFTCFNTLWINLRVKSERNYVSIRKSKRALIWI